MTQDSPRHTVIFLLLGGLAVILLAALFLGGCAGQQLPPLPIPFAKPTDTVSFDRVEVALALGDIQGLVMVLEAKATERCRATNTKTPSFSPETCQTIQQGIDQAAALKQTIVTALRNPKVEIDWAEVAKVVKLLVSIAMKFA